MEIGLYTTKKWGVTQRNQYLDEFDSRFHYLQMILIDLPQKINASANACFSVLVTEHINHKKFSYGVRIIGGLR